MSTAQYTYYDLVAHVVPGLVVIVTIKLLLDGLGIALPHFGLGTFASLSIGIVAAYLAGLFLQAIASSFEPKLFYCLCKGQPSKLLVEKLLTSEKPSMAREYVKRLATLTAIPAEKENADRLFAAAKDYVNARSLGRAELLLAVYTLMRGLLVFFFLLAVVLLMVLLLTRLPGKFSIPWIVDLNIGFLLEFLAGAVTMLVLIAVRFTNRARAYAVEVINMAGSKLWDFGEEKKDVNGT